VIIAIGAGPASRGGSASHLLILSAVSCTDCFSMRSTYRASSIAAYAVFDRAMDLKKYGEWMEGTFAVERSEHRSSR